MTKEFLEQYPDICGELEELKKRNLFPWRQNELKQQKKAVEDFVDSLPESRQRQVVMLRAMEGLTWQQVAGRMGARYSISNAKKIYYEIQKKYLESERKWPKYLL